MASTVDDFQAAQTANYSKWVAIAPINIDGVRAFNPGDPVPDDPHVKQGIVSKDQVVGANTPRPRAAVTGTEA